MESRQESLFDHLNQLANGELDLLVPLLTKLAQTKFWVPLRSDSNDDPKQRNQVHEAFALAIEKRGSRNVLLSYLSEQTEASPEFTCVFGGDLDLLVPEDVWLIIDFGGVKPVSLPRKAVRLMAHLEIISTDEDKPVKLNAEKPEKEFVSSAEEYFPPPGVTREDVTLQSRYAVEGRDSVRQHRLREESTEYRAPSAKTENLSAIARTRLVEIAKSNPAVREMYYVPSQEQLSIGIWSGGIVGILCEPLDPDKRFELVEQLAIVSREIFGEAGALDVYDDLGVATSSSWALFSMESPIYVREKESEQRKKESIPSFPGRTFASRIELLAPSDDSLGEELDTSRFSSQRTTFLDRISKVFKSK